MFKPGQLIQVNRGYFDKLGVVNTSGKFWTITGEHSIYEGSVVMFLLLSSKSFAGSEELHKLFVLHKGCLHASSDWNSLPRIKSIWKIAESKENHEI